MIKPLTKQLNLLANAAICYVDTTIIKVVIMGSHNVQHIYPFGYSGPHAVGNCGAQQAAPDTPSQ